MQGKIIKILSNDYTVLSNNNIYLCKARGKFRNMQLTPVVGDEVIFDIEKKYIIEILPRKNYLVRPPVSNIDICVVVTSLKDPLFSSNLLDKLLTIIEFNNVKPVICFTKLDLLSEEELKDFEKIFNYYKKIGYEVYNNLHLNEFKKIFENKIVVFTGQSGAGKSSLLNKLDNSLNLKTDDISYALNRGKHTTRYVELMPLLSGFVADTPGFSAVNFDDMQQSDIRDNFIEFNEYKEFCKYRDCMHEKEDDCEIKRQVESGNILRTRYENYLKFIHKERY